jgi:hypothetical protein
MVEWQDHDEAMERWLLRFGVALTVLCICLAAWRWWA